jgi:PAS domain S-box-containing protein
LIAPDMPDAKRDWEREMVSFNNLVQPIWEVSPYPLAVISYEHEPQNRKFVYVNPAFINLTGYARYEAVGQPATLLHGPRTDLAAIRECEMKLLQGEAFSSPLVHYRKDGSEYACQATIAPLVEPDGGEHFLIMIETSSIPSDEMSLSVEIAPIGVQVPLALPMPLKEYPDGKLPAHLRSHPELDALLAVWTEIRGSRPLPLRADFDLETVKRWASHLSIATVAPNGRFQFRLFGTELARVYGRDLTGSFLDDLTPRDLWSVISLHYHEVVGSREPLFAPISIANGHWYNEVSRLLLPLATERGTVGFVMGVDYVRKFG